MRKRGQLLAHIQNTRAQYSLPVFGRKLAYKTNRVGVVDHFADPSVQKSIAVDLVLIDQYDALITDLELTIVREAKRHNADAFHRLCSVPGIGKVLALAILYEIHDVMRFDRVQAFASYARLVKCQKQYNSPPTFSTASRIDPSSTCVYTFNVVSTLACPISLATTLLGTPLSCDHEE